MKDTIEKEMNLLLNNFWITKEEQKDDYYLLKRNQNFIRDFTRKNLGNKLIIHDRFIKLEKIPAQPKPELGIKSFIEIKDYVFLFLFLLYLEDKTRGEKFILSDVIQYIKNTAITLELSHVPNWNYTNHRKSLVRVINYLVEKYVIILKDQDNKNFGDTEEADALYEITGISNYVVRSFDTDIYHCKTPEDFLKNEWGEQEEKGDIRKYKIYRRLLYTPAVTKTELSESEYDYLKKMHRVIEKELSEQINMEVEITKNLALLFAPLELQQKEYFPNNKKISDIVLIINRKLMELKKTVDETECFTITKDEFDSILENARIEEAAYFSKQYLDLSFQKYREEIITFMSELHLIKEEEEILCYPIISRYVGKTNLKKDKGEQLELEVI